jgi:RHS repeat-associated protein
VWLPTEPTSGIPTYQYVYAPAARPAVVQQRRLMQRDAAVYQQSWTYVDGLGREIQTQRADVTPNLLVASSKAYDSMGRVLYSSSPYSATGIAGAGYLTPTWNGIANYSRAGYDDLGNQTRTDTMSSGTVLWSTTSRFDAWQQHRTDANGNSVDQSYDAFGKLIAVTEYNTGNVTATTQYAYDTRGSLTRVTDALMNTTVITYDLLGRKAGMVDPDMGGWTYRYDPNGNLITQTDALSQTLVMQYDTLNRLIAKRTVTGTLLSESIYDAAGQKGLLSSSKAYNGEGTIEVRNVTYDARNRLTQRQWIIPGAGGGTFRIDYGYDEADNQVTLRYPGGNNGEQGELMTRSYYTQTGQLNRVVSDDGTPFINYTLYSPQGQMIQQQLDQSPNGLTRQFTYDASTLRLSSLSAGTASPWNNLQSLNYAYALNGNITSLVDGVNSNQRQCFQYDQLSRLTSAFTGDATCAGFSSGGVGAYNHTVAYNAIGNITNYNGNAYTYGAQPHAVTAAFSNTYTYDVNGNQTLRQIAPYTHTLTYDVQGRMTGVSSVREPVTNTITATFLYDVDGIRVKGLVNGVTTVYIAGIYEWQAGATTKYYDGGGMQRSGYASGNGIFYILKDQLGSTSVIVSQAGAVQATDYYYPFGANRGDSAFSELTSKRFTGQYGESGLAGNEGLNYYGARWYDPQLGRFASPDSLVPRPHDPQSLNRFAYARDNPVNRTDPTGFSDSCNSSLYNCNSGGTSSNDPIDYLPWYATQSQRARAQLRPKEYKWHKTVHYILLCGKDYKCSAENGQYAHLASLIQADGGNVQYLDKVISRGRSNYDSVQKDLQATINGIPLGEQMYLVGHSAGAQNIVSYLSKHSDDPNLVLRIIGAVLLEPELKTGMAADDPDNPKYHDSQEDGQKVIDTLGVNRVLVIGRPETHRDNLPLGCAVNSTSCNYHAFSGLSHIQLTSDTNVADDIYGWTKTIR